MSRSRVLDGLAIVLSLAVAAGLGFVTRPHATAPRSETRAVIHSQQVAPPAAPTALFIGDSYTSGKGLAEMSYTCMAARRMGWICDLGAEPGTGYVSGGSANRFVRQNVGASTSIVERIPRLARIYHPDFVILDGGRKDTFLPLERTFNAMQTAINSAHRAWPNAAIIFERPRLLAQPDNNLGYDDAFIERLEGEQPALIVVDPIALLIGTDTSEMLQEDGMNPNRAGELALASALTASLQSDGIAARS